MPEETPPVETPPVETPPVETPPVETPPVETPPVETPPVETPPVETPPVETDWRTSMAGDDEKALKKLERFSDQPAMLKAYLALENKLHSGEYVRKLADDATDEEKAAWRTEVGVPEESKGYIENLELPDGVVLGEQDAPIAESFAEHAHKNDWAPKQFNEAMTWYYAHQEKMAADQDDKDAAYHQTSDDALRADWEGADYRRNLAAISNLMATWPDGLKESVLAARTPDGTLLGDSPEFSKTMAELAVKINPAATLIPANSADPAKGVEGRLAEIKGWMGSEKGSEDWKKYWKDDNIQKEYTQLLTAQGQLKAQGQ